MENNLLRRSILAKIDREELPESLTAEDIARLAYPENRKKEGEFLEIIRDAIKAGELATYGTAPEWLGIGWIDQDGSSDFPTYESKLVPKPVLRTWLGGAALPQEAELLRYWLELGKAVRRKPEEDTMQKRREAVLQQWLEGDGQKYIERGKLTLTGPETWKRLATIEGDLFRESAPATIEEFFKNQKVVERKPGRKPKHP